MQNECTTNTFGNRLFVDIVATSSSSSENERYKLLYHTGIYQVYYTRNKPDMLDEEKLNLKDVGF